MGTARHGVLLRTFRIGGAQVRRIRTLHAIITRWCMTIRDRAAFRRRCDLFAEEMNQRFEFETHRFRTTFEGPTFVHLLCKDPMGRTLGTGFIRMSDGQIFGARADRPKYSAIRTYGTLDSPEWGKIEEWAASQLK